MNKLLTKIATAFVGIAMAIGVGVAVGSKNANNLEQVSAESGDSFTFTQAANSTPVSSTDGYWSYTTAKNDGNTAPQISSSQLRIYPKGTITFTGSTNVTLNSASFTLAVNKNSKNVYPTGWSVDNGTLTTFSTSLTAATLTDIDSSSFTITIAGSAGNVGFKTVTMNYTVTGSVTYSVTYNGNGSTGGSVPVDNGTYSNGATVTVLGNTGSLVKTNYTFTGWNTVADGSGSGYSTGDTFSIGANTTLFAQWSYNIHYTDDTTEKTITWDMTNPEYTSASDSQVVWESPRFTMTAAKASSTTNANNYLPPANGSSRFYKDSTLTFAIAGSDDILSIVAEATTSNYATALANSGWTNAEASANDTTVTISPIDGTASISATIGAVVGLSEVVVYYGTFVAPTMYTITNRVDNATLNKSEIMQGATLNVTITPNDGYVLPESLSHVYMAGNPVEYTYSNGVVTVTNVQGNITIEGSCIRTNPIEAIYSKSSGASVDVYGYYVGFLDGTGPIIMDGDYGVVVYNKTADVSSYTENETILHVTGSVSIYNGLYEIGSPTIAVASGTYEAPSAPVVYSVAGGETASYASRLTTLTGVVKSVTPKTSAAADYEWDQTEDVTIIMTVNANDINVFYKKAAQDATDGATIMDALSSQDEITVKGFTGWYKGFQVQMNGIVAAAAGYTAAIFAQDLLDQTDDVCENYDGVTNNHDAILAIWNDLASVDKYPSLPNDQKTVLADATYEIDQYGVVQATNGTNQTIAEAMARYEYLTGKYSLSNFINGRTPVVFANSSINMIAKNSSTTTIIVVVSMLSLISVSGFFFLRRRKEQ